MKSALKSTLTLTVLLLGIPAAIAAPESGIVDVIRFSGNKKTQEIVMRQEMLVREGDPLDLARIERSRQAIMNLGLFKSVDAQVLQEEGHNVLLIAVEERFYILPLPLLDARLDEAEYSYGMELRYDNLMGLNQRLKLTYEHDKTADGETPMRRESSLSYSYPRVLGSNDNFSLNGNVIREELIELDNEIITGSYRRDSRNLGFRVSRWLAAESISQGWVLGGGMAIAQRIYDQQRGSGENYDNSQALEVNVSLDYSAIEEYPYHREGSAYGYWLSVSMPGMGSDYTYNRVDFYHRNYHPLGFIDASLHTQVKLGLANGNRFDAPAFSVGGGSSIRGYEGEVAQGNAMLQLNAEYHHHLSGYRQLRGVVFMDAGNAWSGGTDLNLGKLFSSAGVGLRWRVQSFVDMTLRLDIAYAIDAKETKFHASTSSSF